MAYFGHAGFSYQMPVNLEPIFFGILVEWCALGTTLHRRRNPSKPAQSAHKIRVSNQNEVPLQSLREIRKFPKIRGTFWEDLTMRTLVYWGPYWGPNIY